MADTTYLYGTVDTYLAACQEAVRNLVKIRKNLIPKQLFAELSRLHYDISNCDCERHTGGQIVQFHHPFARLTQFHFATHRAPVFRLTNTTKLCSENCTGCFTENSKINDKWVQNCAKSKMTVSMHTSDCTILDVDATSTHDQEQITRFANLYFGHIRNIQINRDIGLFEAARFHHNYIISHPDYKANPECAAPAKTAASIAALYLHDSEQSEPVTSLVNVRYYSKQILPDHGFAELRDLGYDWLVNQLEEELDL